jgi:hypothetical protein
MVVLDFVFSLQFVVGVVIGWLVVPHLINFGKKFLKK